MTLYPWCRGWLAALLLSGCATGALELPRMKGGQPSLVLLGEVHDNAAQHALRQRAFAALLAGGARPALALEQFDRERQPAIDRLLAASPAPDADAVIAAGTGGKASGSGNGGWNWDHYRPFIALALQYGLPIVAANVSRDEARAVMRQGLAANGFDATVPDDLLQAHAGDIEASHCGAIDRPTAQRMALAQVARDQFMARVLHAQAERGAVLLAGNGHVRKDIGVPRWLGDAARAHSLSVGVLEDGDAGFGRAFDETVFTAAAKRADPCEGMKPRAASSASP